MGMIQLEPYLLHYQAKVGRKIPIKELAEATGISRDTLSRLLNSYPTRIDESTVFALCKFFGIPKGSPIPFLIYDPDV